MCAGILPDQLLSSRKRNGRVSHTCLGFQSIRSQQVRAHLRRYKKYDGLPEVLH